MQKVKRRFFGEEWAYITINIHKLSKKKEGGEGEKGSKGIFWEIMGPSETKYSQINKEKQKKDAKSTKGFFWKNEPKSTYYEGKNTRSSYLENKFQLGHDCQPTHFTNLLASHVHG